MTEGPNYPGPEPGNRQQQMAQAFAAPHDGGDSADEGGEDVAWPVVPQNRPRSAQDSLAGAGQGAEPSRAWGDPGADPRAAWRGLREPGSGSPYDAATTVMLSWFDGSHLVDPRLAQWSARFLALAEHIAEELTPGAERSAGLRHLLEAKDCIVRAQIHTDRQGEHR